MLKYVNLTNIGWRSYIHLYPSIPSISTYNNNMISSDSKIFLFSVAYLPPYDTKKARMVKCGAFNLMKVGCYHEREASQSYLPLAVPELLLTADKSSHKFVGYERYSFSTYRDFLKR